jgi:ATP-dependent DNA helicase DinG
MSQTLPTVNQPVPVAHDLIDFIFHSLLPLYGMKIREAQIELAHRMLDVLSGRKIALHEAGVGIGKTFSYLIAAIAFHLCLPDDWWVRNHYPFSHSYQKRTPMPIVISTSSIALQQAIQTDYLPFLSDVLMEHHVIQKPLRSVVRKGKSHYLCDRRLADHLAYKNTLKQNVVQRQALLSLRQSSIDLDQVPNLSPYDRKHVCVDSGCNNQCPERFSCRYFRQMLDTKSPEILFQICNHNYLLADLIHRQVGKEPLLPNYKALVIDEGHKLHEAAQQMFALSLQSKDFEALLEASRKLKGLRGDDYQLLKRIKEDQRELFLSLRRWIDGSGPVADTDETTTTFTLTDEMRSMLHKLQNDARKLLELHTRLDNRRLRAQTQQIMDRIQVFLHPWQSVIHQLIHLSRTESINLAATPIDIRNHLVQHLWDSPIPTVMTSGTLAIRGDFSRTRSVLGLDLIRDKRQLDEFVAASPFNYRQNCLLYLPSQLPAVDPESESYLQALTEQVTHLIKASHGHTLVLFNSYRMMSRIRELIDSELVMVPLLVANRDIELTIRHFKELPNAVLFATGVCWEGIDFAGDLVSSLIIVTLPFAVPDEIRRREQQQYACLRDFIQATIVPAMQQKLKQGFGRAIRTETDTCVVSILDPRALAGARYHNHTLAALPDCPLTHQLQDVAEFIYRVKDQSYFTI